MRGMCLQCTFHWLTDRRNTVVLAVAIVRYWLLGWDNYAGLWPCASWYLPSRTWLSLQDNTNSQHTSTSPSYQEERWRDCWQYPLCWGHSLCSDWQYLRVSPVAGLADWDGGQRCQDSSRRFFCPVWRLRSHLRNTTTDSLTQLSLHSSLILLRAVPANSNVGLSFSV